MMQGHYAYYGITGNTRRLRWYAHQVEQIDRESCRPSAANRDSFRDRKNGSTRRMQRRNAWVDHNIDKSGVVASQVVSRLMWNLKMAHSPGC
jgi:hypothetical protein